MKTFLTLLFLLPASTCFAQVNYTYVLAVPTQTADEMIPAYHSIADTINKPYTKLFKRSKLQVVGKLGNRWTVAEKAGVQYVIRTSLLPADAQQVVSGATSIKPIPVDPATGRIIYSEVVQATGANQTELYARAKLWFASTFNSANAVIQADEKDAGVIQGTGYQDVYTTAGDFTSKEKLWYTVKIAVKDGRYKYDITDLRVQSYPSQYNPHPGEPGPAEAYLKTDALKGIGLGYARSTQREVAIAGHALAASVTTGMDKPVAGKDW